MACLVKEVKALNSTFLAQHISGETSILTSCPCILLIFLIHHRGVITDREDSNKMADAINPGKQLAFLKQRNHI